MTRNTMQKFGFSCVLYSKPKPRTYLVFENRVVAVIGQFTDFLGPVKIPGQRDPSFKVYPIRSSVTTCINVVQKPAKSTVKCVISADCNENDREILLW
jgi:hypothetical protein